MAGGRAPCLAMATSLMLLVSHPASSTGISIKTARIALDACVRRLNPETDIGYERVTARCPDLVRRLDESGLAAWLPRDWRRPGNDLSPGGLRELDNLLALQDRNSSPPTHQPNVRHLPAVLAGFAGGGAAERNGWWARTKAWLRDVFERREEEDDNWFSRVVGHSGLSQAVIELVSYVALALVVVLAGVIVVNELQVEGMPGRLWRRYVARRRTAVSVVGAEREGANVSTWEEVQKAAPAQRPRMLLELVATRLTEEGRLPQSRALTARELAHLARLPDEADRGRLLDLARMAERMRFSNDQVPDTAVGAVLEGGRLLLERISVATDELRA
jgi:hypothetical protein